MAPLFVAVAPVSATDDAIVESTPRTNYCTYMSGFLSIYVFFDAAEAKAFTPPTGTLRLIGQEANLADGRWLSFDNKDVSIEVQSASADYSMFLWGVPFNSDEVALDSFYDRSSVIKEYYGYRWAISQVMIRPVGDESYTVNCNPIVPSPDPNAWFWEFDKPAVVEASDSFLSDDVVRWCVRPRELTEFGVWLDNDAELHVVLNYGDDMGLIDNNFVPPEDGGTMVFANGVEIELGEAFLDESTGWWVVRTGLSSGEVGADWSPAVVNIGERKPYTIDESCQTPIAVDIDNSGAIELTDTPVDFDFDSDGDAEQVSQWFGPKDGILVDGRASGPMGGHYLFGDEGGRYSSGYEKLAELDLDGDQQIAGSELVDIKLWFDLDGDAEIDFGELEELEAHGIEWLSVEHSAYRSAAGVSDGTTRLTEDVFFADINPDQSIKRTISVCSRCIK